MWLKKLLNSFKKLNLPVGIVVNVTLGISTLLYPVALYFFRETFSVFFFMGFAVILVALRFIDLSKNTSLPLEKKDYLFPLFIVLTLSVLFRFQGYIAAFYYPVVMSFAMAFLFFASLFSPSSFIEKLARLKDPNLPPSGIFYTRQVTKIWGVFCVLNAFISYGTVLLNNLEIWTLYNGIISYILMGVLLGGEFLFRGFYKKKKHSEAFKNFVSLEGLLQKSSSYWEAYWGEDSQNYTREIEGVAQSILDHSLAQKSNRVFLISQDRMLFCKGFLAIMKAGKTVVLPHANTPNLLEILLQKGDIILSDQEDLAENSAPFINLKKTKKGGGTSLPKIKTTCEIIFYTSGSTGAPKAIHKKLFQLENEVRELQKTWPLKSNPNAMLFSMVPPHHVYGFLFSFLWPLCAKIPLSQKTVRHWEELPQGDMSECYLVSSPAHLGRFPQGFTVRLNRVFSSGGPLSFEKAQLTKEATHVLPTEVYGSTETGGVAYRQQRFSSTVWTTFSEVHIQVDRDSKLSVKSPYLHEDGFYQTADIVALKNKGQFSLKGRGDRIVKVEGKRLCLLELEKKLSELPEIKDAYTLLLEGKNRQEVGAIIELSDLGKHNLKVMGKVKFTRVLRQKLQDYFDLIVLPRRWHFVDDIPRTPQGKRPDSLMKEFFEKKEV